MTFAVWKTKYDVRLGEDATPDNNLDRPAIAALPNGGYVVGWRENNQLKFKVYDGGGNPIGPNGGTVYSVTAGLTDASAFQNAIDIQAVGTDGSFAISWNEGTGSSFDLRTRVFTHNGDGNYAGGTATEVYGNASADTYLASMSGKMDGRFVSTYVEGNNIVLHLHDANGSTMDTYPIPNEPNAPTITNPELTQISGTVYAISYNQGNKVYVRIVDPGQTLPKTGFEVGDSFTRSEVVALKDENGALLGGQFAVVWQIGHRVLAKFYNADGNRIPNTGEVEVTGTAGGDSFNVVALRGGRIAVTHSGNAADTGTRKAFLTVTDMFGTKPAGVPLALGAAENQHSVRVVEMTDGRLAVAWEDPSRVSADISSAIVDPRLVGVTVNGTARNDYYVGSEYNDVLFGNDGADVLVGGAGNDALFGGGGQDTFQGGEGKDTVSYRNAVARVEDGKTLGVNVYLHKADGLSNAGEAHGDHFNGIEVIDGSRHADVLEGDGAKNEFWADEGNDTVRGFDGDDVLKGADGADVLDGGAGNDALEGGNSGDVLYGGAGADSIDGGDGYDYLTYEFSTSGVGVTVSLDDPTKNRGDAQGDTYINIEGLTGTNYNDVLLGWAGAKANEISGYEGNDYIVGGAENDRLSGGYGNDTLIGGEGNNELFGGDGDGFDIVSYEHATGRLVINLEGDTASQFDIIEDTLQSIEGAIGSNFGDDIDGNEVGNLLVGMGGRDFLTGRGGNDTLEGGDGNDELNGGEGFDYASYQRSTSGVSVVLLLGEDGVDRRDTFLSIEGLIGSNHSDTLTGNEAANHLKGEGGNDTLNGGGGPDTLEGGAGDDTYHVDASDTIVEGAGQGIDTVVVTTDFTLSPGAVIENIVLLTTATVRLLGNELDNVLTGNAGVNVLNGQAGNDLIVGGAGADNMTGGFGNDTIYVDDAGDVVVEEAGQGIDTVMVNTAAYVLGAGAEVEFLVAGAGAINLTGSNSANAITGNTLSNNLWGQAGHDRITAGSGNDKVYGGADNDLLWGEIGNDQLKGDAGNDKVYGGLGNDKLYGGTGRDVFVFDTRTNKSTNVDKIYDFKSSDDSFHLDNAIFTKLGRGSAAGVRFKSDMFVEGTRAQDREDRIVYDKKTGSLYYDKDGTGGSAQVKIATITNKTKLYYHDFFVV